MSFNKPFFFFFSCGNLLYWRWNQELRGKYQTTNPWGRDCFPVSHQSCAFAVSMFRVRVENMPLAIHPYCETLTGDLPLVCEGFGTSLCATHRLPSPGDKIEKGSVSLTALVDSHLCETWSLENQWEAAGMTLWWTAAMGEGANIPRRWSRTCTYIWSK